MRAILQDLPAILVSHGLCTSYATFLVAIHDLRCPGCTRGQCFHQPPAGLLNPLVAPCCPWSYIAVDFVTGFPLLDGNTAILTVVDHFSKTVHFIPLTNTPFHSRDWGSPGLTCFPTPQIPVCVWRAGEMCGCPEPCILECISDLGGVFP